MKVLAIDDNTDNLLTIRALIGEFFPSAEVQTATGGVIGYELARAAPPDIVLLDILMPDLDGFEVCRMFKSDVDLKDIPLLFLSATKENRENRIKALEAGGEGFLSKPLDEVELRAQISVMYRIKQARDEKRSETRRLEKLVDRRTKDLVRQLGEIKRADEALRKNMEELIVAKEKAEAADRLKSAFLANVSHEIRTPMNAIIGFCEMLAEPGIDEDERSRFTGIISSRSQDLLHLITEILDIAGIESGDTAAELSDVNIDQLLFEIEQETLSKIQRNKKNHLAFRLDHPASGAGFSIMTDYFLVKKVLGNFIDNAIRYTHQGLITLGYDPPKSHFINFYVSDTGIGIKPEDQESIFMTFRQAEIENRSKYGGTGLGLAICKGFAGLLGGQVSLSSIPGEGSTFFLKIPYQSTAFAHSPKPAAIVSKPIAQLNLKGKRVLLVEDDLTNMEYLKILLQSIDAEVICSYSGKDVRKIYNELNAFDLVLLDIRLPDANGLELASEMKAIRSELPVIAQTAYAMSTDRKLSFDAGCDGYIPKPVRKEELLNLIATLLH